MATVAEQLRGARERLKLSVYDVAEATKIKTDHVRALEEGNYDAFAAPVYIRGFVRNCANLLRLDVGQVLRDLDGELAGTERFSEAPSLTGNADGFVDRLMLQVSKLPWQLVVLLLGIAIVGVACFAGFRLWDHYHHGNHLIKLGPGLYEPANPHTGEVLPLP